MTLWNWFGVISCSALLLGMAAFCVLSMEMTARQDRKREEAEDARRIQG